MEFGQRFLFKGAALRLAGELRHDLRARGVEGARRAC